MSRRNQRSTAEIPLNTDLPEDVYVSLNKFCDEKRIAKKRVVELALRRFFVAEGKKSAR